MHDRKIRHMHVQQRGRGRGQRRGQGQGGTGEGLGRGGPGGAGKAESIPSHLSTRLEGRGRGKSDTVSQTNAHLCKGALQLVFDLAAEGAFNTMST